MKGPQSCPGSAPGRGQPWPCAEMGAAGLVKAGSRDVVCQGSAGVLREGLTATWLGHQGDSQPVCFPSCRLCPSHRDIPKMALRASPNPTVTFISKSAITRNKRLQGEPAGELEKLGLFPPSCHPSAPCSGHGTDIPILPPYSGGKQGSHVPGSSGPGDVSYGSLGV